MNRKVLIVDDERSIVDILRYNLEKNDMTAVCAYDGAEGLRLARECDPDVILLDVMLPEMDGFEVCRTLRAEGNNVPIIMITAREEETDKVFGLELGADDYITKPFGTSELLARIRTALRHTRTAATSSSIATSGRFKAGGLEIDYEKRRVFVDGESGHLTQNEYKIVSMLGLYAGRVLTYDYMLRELWGLSTKENRQILRVNMANIRRKLEKNPAEPQYIFTEIGVGYWMREAD